METLTVSHPFPFSHSHPRQVPPLSFSTGFSLTNRLASVTKARASIRPPPLGFDYRMELMEDSRSAAAAAHPELMDLVEEGMLVLVGKRRFGPVPEWRREFVEPEAIWLVGTSHISRKSAADVQRVVRALRPDSVVVELCRSRAGIMYASKDAEDSPLLKSNMFSLGGTEFFGAVSRSINLGGQSALVLRLLLAVLSSKIPLGENRYFGDEFRAARKSSEELGAQIVLGDRPIEITLERAWNSLVWSEKLNLVISLFRGITSSSFDISESGMKGAEMEGGPFQLYEQLSKSYPSLLQPLVYERDTVHPNSYCLVLSTENITLNWYLGQCRSMLVSNCLFRVGGAAVLLSNRRPDRRRSKYQLVHTVRTHKGADDRSFHCVYQEEDPTGRVGVSLSKDLMSVAGEALKTNITTLGPLVLPMSEQLLFFASLVARRVLRAKGVKPYIPDFKLAFEHLCIHAGGRGVLDEVEKNLRLTDWHMEPSRMTLWRFGNTSSSSLWYELAYTEAKGRMRKGDRTWQIAFGSGFKCNSAVWRALKSVDPPKEKNPWMDEIDRFPVRVE